MKISILSNNILAPQWADCTDYDLNHCGILATKIRREKIIKNINKYNAEIVILQEVSLEEYNEFKTRLKQYQLLPLAAHIRKWAHDEDGNKIMTNGNCILLKKKMFKKIKSKKLQLSKDGMMASICECEINNTPLIIVSAHLDDLKRSVRKTQLKNLMSKLATKDETTSVVIGADFNESIKYVNKFFKKYGYESAMKKIVPTYYDTKKYDLDNIYFKNLKWVNTQIPQFKDAKDILKTIGTDHASVFTTLALSELD